MKFVYGLSKEDEKSLTNLVKNADSYRTRVRAHAIILSAKKYSIDDLANIFEVHRDTVSRWIDVWEEKGMKGLYDAPKPGRPRIYTKEELEEAEKARPIRRIRKIRSRALL